jgi:hypothetical protein
VDQVAIHWGSTDRLYYWSHPLIITDIWCTLMYTTILCNSGHKTPSCCLLEQLEIYIAMVQHAPHPSFLLACVI